MGVHCRRYRTPQEPDRVSFLPAGETPAADEDVRGTAGEDARATFSGSLDHLGESQPSGAAGSL
jgi:hypothetical protein